MSSFEFLYAKMTAQSQGFEPGVQGNKPEFTPAFIAKCVAMITNSQTYHAAMAWYCQSESSMAALNLGMADWCWKRLREKKDPEALRIARVAELGVLMYLYPLAEEKRSIKSCAKWVKVAPETWNRKYSKQRDAIVHELAQMKSDGDAQLSAILRDD